MPDFCKDERLCSRKDIAALIATGNTLFKHPFLISYLETEPREAFPARIVISVSKKKFKRAVDRNFIKRVIRESYRKNKDHFYKQLYTKNKSCSFMILYTGKIIPDSATAEKNIIVLLQRLADSL